MRAIPLEVCVYVQYGNDNAVEGYRDPTSDDPDKVRWRPLEGETITTIGFPEGMTLSEAFTEAVAAVQFHFAPDAKPVWVESDSDGLRALLCEHFGLGDKRRPKTWGKARGLDKLYPVENQA